MDQYLVDYTVRNITTGDEEDIRILELLPAEFDGFPDTIRPELQGIIAPLAARFRDGKPIREWDEAQERILALLMPYISDPATYHADYETWERRLLDSGLNAVERITEAHTPEDVASAVRVALVEAVDAAIENWAEGHWEDWHADITRGEVLNRLTSFIASWQDTSDDADLAEDMGFNERIMPEVEA